MADKISQIQLPNGVTYDIDTRVQQTASTIETSLPILLGYGAAPNATGVAYYSSGISVIPGLNQISTDGTIYASVFNGELHGRATSAGSADSAANALDANHADVADSATVAESARAFTTAANVALTGDITGSVSSAHGWSVDTTISTGAVRSTHIANEAITVEKLADEIGVVVVQSSEPANDSAAKIWVKI